jgi:hypothetical protein
MRPLLELHPEAISATTMNRIRLRATTETKCLSFAMIVIFSSPKTNLLHLSCGEGNSAAKMTGQNVLFGLARCQAEKWTIVSKISGQGWLSPGR